ncbi:hypothetical protein PSQ90_07830 [Devosia rhodophyticola]|uniref:Uncharacterized protein n=1 Tax=Devosia rhodophyticola TaxID=3026423 RepID=A0ABY7Z1P1_9HYPH|nr:hypothetical protein [Devosia rhodophyticola]WDR07317.1 hypothetical protein PSQ90_07830 [Devosia rhodophyticola]
MTDKNKPKSDKAPAFKNDKKTGPDGSPVQVRDSGKENMGNKQKNWTKHDEEIDESFPASDPPANY